MQAQVQRHQVEEGKVYIIRNGEPIELKNDGVYVMINGQLEKIDMPATGYGNTIVEWRYGQVKMVKSQINYSEKYFEQKQEIKGGK